MSAAASTTLVAKAHPELQLPHRQRRSKAQRRARRAVPIPAQVKTQSWVWGDDTHHVVHAAEVGPVEDVEAFGNELHVGLLRQFELAAQAHVEVHVVGPNAGVPPDSWRTFGVGGVVVAIEVRRPGQQIERMSAVVTNNRSKFKAGKDMV